MTGALLYTTTILSTARHMPAPRASIPAKLISPVPPTMLTAIISPPREGPTPRGEGEESKREGEADINTLRSTIPIRTGNTRTEAATIGTLGTTIGAALMETEGARGAAVIAAARATTASGSTPPGAGDTTSYREEESTVHLIQRICFPQRPTHPIAIS